MSLRDFPNLFVSFARNIPLVISYEIDLVLARADGNHARVPVNLVLAQQDAPEPRPALKNVEVCERCHQVPGIRHFDYEWCCEACGQAVLDKVAEEATRPVPPKTNKPIQPLRPGQRGRRK